MKKSLFSLMIATVFVVSGVLCQAQGVMTTWIGDGNSGYKGDGGPADSAELSDPFGVCFDASGNLYISDQGNFAIRRVDAVTGIITTVAGTGQTGYSGDGGPANKAFLGNVTGICADPSGNVFFADVTYAVIREINISTGIITTVAGNGSGGYGGDSGPAINAMLNNPQGICYASGSLLIADAGNNRIRKVDLSSGIITTVAGNGNAMYFGNGGPAVLAGLSSPSAVCVNADGYLFIADMNNSVIRKINPQTGIISTIAGTGFGGFGGDGGLAINAVIGDIDGMAIDQFGNLYIDDVSCSCRKITVGTDIINVVAGNGTESGYTGDGGSSIDELLQTPAGLCVDPSSGNIIIADAGNNRIRRATQPNFFDQKNLGELNPSIYPVPAPGVFTIKLQDNQKYALAEVYGLNGQKVFSSILMNDINTVDLTAFASGAYVVKIKLPTGGAYTQKVTVINN